MTASTTKIDRFDALLILGLYVLVMAVFTQVIANDWTNIDDGLYVYENPVIRNGLTGEGVRYAFTQTHGANWHPLTSLSHMLDVSLYGLVPQRHRLLNVALHALNSVLLYLFFRHTTGNHGASAFVAVMFAIHPLHVESVAWISSRKDVLSTCFWFACMLAYARYAAIPSIRKYAAVALLLALGLMSKPMVVTLPIVLFLLDWWPLDRIHTSRDALWRGLEKAPLLLLSLASGLATIWAQSKEGAVSSLALIPMRDRITNALLSYLLYIKKCVVPTDLAIFYPHMGKSISLLEAGIFLVVLLAISIAAIALARRLPYIAVGWFWFAITLLPVIGIMQVGFQGMADRYTYIPHVGLFVIAAFGISALSERVSIPNRVRWVTACLLCIATAALAFQQARLWRSNVTLWEHAVALFPDDARCHNGYGTALLVAGRADEAIEQIKTALRLDNKQIEVNSNMANALAEQGRYEEAVPYYQLELGFDPSRANVRVNFGNTLLALGRNDEAREQFRLALETKSTLAEANNGLGVSYLLENRFADAIPPLEQAAQQKPDAADILTNLAVAYEGVGRRDDAIAACTQAIAADPAFTKAQAFLQQLQQP